MLRHSRGGNAAFGPNPTRDPTDRLRVPILGILAGAERNIRTTTPADVECPQCGNRTLYNAIAERTARVLFFPIMPISSTKEDLSVCVNTACSYRGPAVGSIVPSASVSSPLPTTPARESLSQPSMSKEPPTYQPGDRKQGSLSVQEKQQA